MSQAASIQQTISAAFPSDFLFAVEAGFLSSPRERTAAWIVGTLIVLGAAWFASTFSVEFRRKARAKQARARLQSNDVFGEICAAHKMSLKEKRLLQRGATVMKLASPAMLFVDSGLLNQLATSDRRDAAEFAQLAGRLFPQEEIRYESKSADPAETQLAV